MDDTIFKDAVGAISSGEYTENDVQIVKGRLDSLSKKELSIKRKLEKTKNDFVRNKDRTNTELRTVRSEIKKIKSILKAAV